MLIVPTHFCHCDGSQGFNVAYFYFIFFTQISCRSPRSFILWAPFIEVVDGASLRSLVLAGAVKVKIFTELKRVNLQVASSCSALLCFQQQVFVFFPPVTYLTLQQ
uniref:Uncharacterized protein n=1 Tax=Trypanosoma congolense (strain IL3000) TaxID=1068625 RepID=G0UMV1_TRYCI|nr:hypothetical protein, unlikely [Trypanosoma congolense IL3000]